MRADGLDASRVSFTYTLVMLSQVKRHMLVHKVSLATHFAKSVIDLLLRSFTPADRVPTKCVGAYTTFADQTGVAWPESFIVATFQCAGCA